MSAASRAEMLDPLSTVIHVAVVVSGDGVVFGASTHSRRTLIEELSAFVRRSADVQLWPESAQCVHSLLDSRELERAVELYFARVGERWDEQRLVVTSVGTPASRAQILR